MKTTEVIKKTLELNASKEKVWNVLTKDEFTTQWFKEFSEGTRAESDWQEGSKITFLDAKKDGIIGVISTYRPFDKLEYTYNGVAYNGQEDYESDAALSVKGFKESYVLKEANGKTVLDLESEMSEDYFQQMSEAWDRALQVIKKLSEA